MENNIKEKFKLVLNEESFNKLSDNQMDALGRLLTDRATREDKQLLLEAVPTDRMNKFILVCSAMAFVIFGTGALFLIEYVNAINSGYVYGIGLSVCSYISAWCLSIVIIEVTK